VGADKGAVLDPARRSDRCDAENFGQQRLVEADQLPVNIPSRRRISS
jgi:hypothetical protein